MLRKKLWLLSALYVLCCSLFGDSYLINELLDLSEEQQIIIDEQMILIEELQIENQNLQSLLDSQIADTEESLNLNNELMQQNNALTILSERLEKKLQRNRQFLCVSGIIISVSGIIYIAINTL